MKRFFLTLMLTYLCAGGLKAQQVMRNLSFEYLNTKGYVSSWDIGSDKGKYTLTLDTTIAHGGKCSFYMASGKDSADRGRAVASSVIVGPNISNKRILRITAYIKTENLSDGIAAIGMQLNGAKGPLMMINSDSQSKPGTQNWKMHVIELHITPDVQSIVFGAQMTGKGKAWFDDFEISFDDVTLGNTMVMP